MTVDSAPQVLASDTDENAFISPAWGPATDVILLLWGEVFACFLPFISGPDLLSRMMLAVGAVVSGGLISWAALTHAGQLRTRAERHLLYRDVLVFSGASAILVPLMLFIENQHSLTTLVNQPFDMLWVMWVLARGSALVAVMLAIKSLEAYLCVRMARWRRPRNLKYKFNKLKQIYGFKIKLHKEVGAELKAMWREARGEARAA